MPGITITELAQRTGKTRTTIYRHIKAGKLSRMPNGKVQVVDAIALYGELNAMDDTSTVSPKRTIDASIDTSELAAVRIKTSALESEVAHLKALLVAQEGALAIAKESLVDAKVTITHERDRSNKLDERYQQLLLEDHRPETRRKPQVDDDSIQKRPTRKRQSPLQRFVNGLVGG